MICWVPLSLSVTQGTYEFEYEPSLQPTEGPLTSEPPKVPQAFQGAAESEPTEAPQRLPRYLECLRAFDGASFCELTEAQTEAD